jgi:hypothetical protein
MAQPRNSSERDTRPDGGGVIDRVKQSATAQLTSQKDRGTDVLGSVAQAVRSSTQKLRDERHDTVASYVDKAADQIDNWSRRLKEKDVDELLRDIQQVARRRPAVFIGSAFALGLVGARFLKSSRPEDDFASGRESRRTRYGGGSRMSAAYDRSGLELDDEIEVDVTIAADEAGIADVSETVAGSGTTPTARAGRSRKSSSRTERS